MQLALPRFQTQRRWQRFSQVKKNENTYYVMALVGEVKNHGFKNVSCPSFLFNSPSLPLPFLTSSLSLYLLNIQCDKTEGKKR
jgi:hypothetical protein